MKTVLYIDTFSQFGHTNLNKVYLQEFRKKGCKISVIARSNYFKEIEVFEDEVLLRIPESYYFHTGSIQSRLLEIKILRFINKNVELKNFDIVFFSYFDEIAFYFSRLKGNLFFMNHSNVSGLENRIKRFFLKSISQRGTILVFHETIQDQFVKYGINNIIIEPLGLSLPYKNNILKNNNILKDIDTRLIDDFFYLKIFIPTLSKYGDNFLTNSLLDDSFKSLLEEKKILLIIKDKNLDIKHPNVCLLNNFINDEIYQAVFLKSDILILQYPKSFKFKVSASLLECFSNNKPCFISDIEAFRVFDVYFNYDPYYNSLTQLINLIQIACVNKDTILSHPYKKTSLLNPKLNSVINY